MRLVMVPTEELLELTFTYGGKEFSMGVELFKKTAHNVFIPAILDCGVAIEATKLENAMLTYKTELGYFQFKDLKIRLMKLNSNFIYCVESEQESERVNRREAYRVFVGMEVAIKTTDSAGKERNITAIIKDISIVGLGIVTTYDLNIGDEVEAVYTAKDTMQMLLKGTVVRVVEIENRKGKLYGIKFNSRTETLSKYIMRSQLERKSGRLNVGKY